LKIGILGAGFVGLTLTARLLEVPTAEVTLLEVDVKKREMLLNGTPYVEEPELPEILKVGIAEERLHISNELETQEFDALFVTIGTPRPSLSSSDYFFETVVSSMNKIKLGGLLLLRSTVSIGTTNQIQEMAKTVGRSDLSVVFTPERTAEGVALQELRELPQILGADSELDLNKSQNFLEQLGFHVETTNGSRESELAKLACNTWRDVTFAFSNELVVLGAMNDLNTLDAIRVANKDYPRARIPLPGPVGGPCLSKDSYILTEGCTADFLENSVIMGARQRNESLITQVSTFVTKTLTLKPDLTLLLCGLSFKGRPKTNDVRDSFAIKLLSELGKDNHTRNVKIWDPWVSPIEKNDLGYDFVDDIMLDTDYLCVLTNNAPFLSSEYPNSFFASLSKNSVIIDLWSNIEPGKDFAPKLVTLGAKSWSEVIIA